MDENGVEEFVGEAEVVALEPIDEGVGVGREEGEERNLRRECRWWIGTGPYDSGS